MEACYINTAHPDFLSGHQAIAMVNEQLQGNKSQQTNEKGSTKQPSALQTNGAHSPSIDSNAENKDSFFGSFFSGQKKTKKSSNGLMDAVSLLVHVVL
jgi:dynamin 1-like protein